MELYDALKNRRSRYDLTGNSPVSDQRIGEILADAITYTPSAFNSQSSRAVLLFADRHLKLWDIVRQTLQAIVPAAKFAQTEEKIQSFAAGHGTILFYEDMETIAGFQKNFPSYADNFPVWSNQSAGMLQFAVWTSLEQEGLGASLQHYNPLIDAAAAKEFRVPASWKLLAQMPFGTPSGKPSPRQHMSVRERLLIQGEK